MKKVCRVEVVILVLIFSAASFLAGMEAQKARTLSALEDDLCSDLNMLEHEMADVVRSGENNVSPNPTDVIVLRNASANIRDTMTSDQLQYKTATYPNSLLYFTSLNDRLQKTEDVAGLVQQYAAVLQDAPMDCETAGLYPFLEGLEAILSTEQGQTLLRELQELPS